MALILKFPCARLHGSGRFSRHYGPVAKLRLISGSLFQHCRPLFYI